MKQAPKIISKPRMTLLQGGEDDVIIKSLNVGLESSCNDQVLSAGNVLKNSNIQLGSVTPPNNNNNNRFGGVTTLQDNKKTKAIDI
jgi:hypothetical protein